MEIAVEVERLEVYNKIVYKKLTKSEAARIGGLARALKYGSPGTAEGRRRGGYRSLVTHQRNNTGFQMLHKIKHPRCSGKLAELFGIVMGDGGLSPYQLVITTNSETDRQHAEYARQLISALFGIHVSVKKRRGENAVRVTASSRSLVLFLKQLGMPVGDKIKNGISAPSWIYKRSSYKKAFIRGLFDTDGCVYLDRHHAKGKTYHNLGWTITSYSGTLMKDILRLLADIGFSPTNRATQKSAYLRRHKEIVRYFKEVGTSNEKHLRRYESFIDWRGTKVV